MVDAQLLWTACIRVLRDQVTEAVWLSSFACVQPVRSEQDLLILSVPNIWTKERIEARYLGMVVAALAELGSPDCEVVIEVHPDRTEAGAAEVAPLPGLDETSATPQDDLDLGVALLPGIVTGGVEPADPIGTAEPSKAAGHDDVRRDGGLHPKFSFDAFVIGASNRFAHAAALTVAERPGLTYNPLFIYGDAGLGKTHLLQAVGHYVQENYRGWRIRYVSSETFLNEFVESIRTGVQESFKRRYRGVDLLLVDDIQFFEGKKETLDEFFHTFNALHEAGRQVVLSSDRRPDDLPSIDSRLRTRFKGGLVIDIQPPDFETRLAILQKKAEAHAIEVPDPVLEYIATHITDSVRELEGALTQVSAFTRLYNEPLSVDRATQILADLITHRQPRVITPDVIIEAASKLFGIPVEELLSDSRTRPLVTARHVAMYVCRVVTDLSFPQIAKAFGKNDHTTVIHAVQKIEKQMGQKQTIYEQVNELIQLTKGA